MKNEEDKRKKSKRKRREIDSPVLGLVHVGGQQTAFGLGPDNYLPLFNYMRNRESISRLHGQKERTLCSIYDQNFIK